MIELENYRKGRDALAAKIEFAAQEYEEELRSRPLNALTPQEIGLLYDLNESFCGADADVEKLRQYAALKDAVVRFVSDCAEAHQITEHEPNQAERNAVIRLDVKAITTMSKQESSLLADALRAADFVVVSPVDDYIRYSFAVENIWKDERRKR